MSVKDSLKVIIQFITFAFYPMINLIVCSIFTFILFVILIIVSNLIPKDSIGYSIVYALATGAIGSFFVSIIVEMSSNYRHNELAFNELQDYHQTFISFELAKQSLFQYLPTQSKEKKALGKYKIASDKFEDCLFEENDIIQFTWQQLHKVVPIMKNTLENKKEFLSNKEIKWLSLIISDYNAIRRDLLFILDTSLLIPYNKTIQEEVLYSKYSRSIVDSINPYIKNHLLQKERTDFLNHFLDVIMSDCDLLKAFFGDYDISQNGLDNYKQEEEVDDYSTFESSLHKSNDFTSYEKEGDIEENLLEMNEKLKSVLTFHICTCCSNIFNGIEHLEKIILKKPYYGMMLKYSQK